MWFNEQWRRWMAQAPRQLRRRGRPSRLHKQLTLEALEDRTLLSPISTTGDLIAAIKSANSAGGATILTLASGASFNFTSENNAIHGANALPVITGNITIVGNDDTIERSNVSGTPAFRLFDVASSGLLTLQNLMLEDGLAQGTGTAAEGGAVYSSGSLNLSGVTVKSNTAQGSNGANGVGEFQLHRPYGSGTAGGNGDNGSEAAGGGIFMGGGSVSLSNDAFSGNQAFGGNGGNGGSGALGMTKGGGNRTGGNGGNGGNGGAAVGGGLYAAVAGSLTLVNDSFINNDTYAGYGGSGGSAGTTANGGNGGNGGNGQGGGLFVFAVGNVSVSDDTFSGNGAFGGLGGLGGDGGGSLAETFVGGTGGNGGYGGYGGDGQGGGLFVAVGTTTSTITLVNDTLNDNGVQGGFGWTGGAGGQGGPGLIEGGPSGIGGLGGAGGDGQGGGLYVGEGITTLINDTIAINQAFGGNGGNGGAPSGPGGDGGSGEGGGFYVPVGNIYGLANTLIAGNNVEAGLGGGGSAGPGLGGANGAAGSASGPDVSGSVVSSDHDLIGDGSGSNLSNDNGVNGNQVGTSTSPIDPKLGPLQYNGGPTQTMALLPGSPAIDAGDNNAPGLPATDQRGYARIVGNAVDIGAYEYGATPATAGLSISGSGSSSTTPGGPITYMFTITNTNSTPQSNVDLTDPLPANATLVSWMPAAGWSSSAPPAGSSSGTVTAWIASLAANSSATFTLVLQAAAGTTAGTVISNTVSIAPIASNSGAISVSIPTLQVVDAGGTYNGNPFPATATAVGTDGEPVAGSFSYAYYAGTGTSGTSLGSTPPANAGTYTVIATFTSNNPDYIGGSALTTFTISPAPISYTIGNDTQAYGWPANLAADLPSSFSTGINGETLDITYSSSGDTSTATVGTYPIMGMVSNGTGLASNYSVTLTDGTLTVLGPGDTVVGSTLWIVGGTTTNDNVDVDPVGASWTGSTGVKVDATLNRVHTSKTYNQSFTALYIFLYSGNDNVWVAPTLTLNTTLGAGNGNDNLQLDNGNNMLTLGNGNDNIGLGDGNNVVTVGDGNDNVVAGGDNNIVTAGKGNDNVLLGCGSNVVSLGDGCDNVVAGGGNNTVTLGNGNDNVWLGDGANTVMVGNGNDDINVGNGNNVIVEGNGHDDIDAGNGDNLIVAGLGRHTVDVGSGSNILIDGSVQLLNGATLNQILTEWIEQGKSSASSISSDLSVTYNTHYANTLYAGSGLDWFWATDTQDHLNVKKTDLLN